MTKKMFARNARLVKGKKWYIDYEIGSESSQDYHRHRHDFGLNAIADEIIREQVGTILARNIGPFLERLQKNFPADPLAAPVAPERGIGVVDALREALNTKLSLQITERTKSDYAHCIRTFEKWAKKHGMDMEVKAFGAQAARSYWAYECNQKNPRTGKKMAGKTLNNKLIRIRALWSEIVKSDHCSKNPFKLIKPTVEEEKNRRNFTPEEAKVVAQEAKIENYWLFRGILLQYYCYIRPVELSRLKFKDFDLAAGTISVLVHKGKKRRRTATIPAAVLKYFRDGKFDQYAINYYVFGIVEKDKREFDFAPSYNPCSEDLLYKRHKKLLQRLKKEGKIKDIRGLTWYSWKDTGISIHAHSASPMATKDQAGHSDFSMTLRYYHAPKINEEYHRLPDTLE